MTPRLVYVASALTTGNQIVNIHLAVKAGESLMRAGHVPVIPHLYSFLELVCPGPSYDDWFNLVCLPLLSRCDAVLRLHGESPGADREVAYAKGLGIPVHYSLLDLLGR